MGTPREPQWLTRHDVEAIHDLQLAQFGGLAALRDAGALESALGRPMNRWHYGETTDVAECAAAYGFAIAKNHAFADGNKRTAFVTMAAFLELNRWRLTASEPDAVLTMLAVADGNMPEARLAEWLRANSERLRAPTKKVGKQAKRHR